MISFCTLVNLLIIINNDGAYLRLLWLLLTCKVNPIKNVCVRHRLAGDGTTHGTVSQRSAVGIYNPVTIYHRTRINVSQLTYPEGISQKCYDKTKPRKTPYFMNTALNIRLRLRKTRTLSNIGLLRIKMKFFTVSKCQVFSYV